MTPTVHTDPEVRPPATRLWRAAAGPLFVVVSFLQMPVKDGFDPSRHAFSYLALGEAGWVQQVNFVAAGILFAVAAARLRAPGAGRARRTAAASGVVMGAGMVLAGVFPVEPSFGFPPGAPAGAPEELGLSGTLHAVAFMVSMTAWVVLLVALGLVLRGASHGAQAAACYLVAVALPVIPVVGEAPFGTEYLYVVATAAFVLTSVTLLRVDPR